MSSRAIHWGLSTFVVVLQTLVDQIAELNPVYQKWYMDDGGIVGDPELLLKAWGILKERGKDTGTESSEV